VVDETSMVDLPLMAKLLVALRPATKLVLVGDPDQLASVEAGAVLADIVGPTGDELRMSAGRRDALAAATGEPLDGVARPRGGTASTTRSSCSGPSAGSERTPASRGWPQRSTPATRRGRRGAARRGRTTCAGSRPTARRGRAGAGTAGA
jgi:hypothetical protein